MEEAQETRGISSWWIFNTPVISSIWWYATHRNHSKKLPQVVNFKTSNRIQDRLESTAKHSQSNPAEMSRRHQKHEDWITFKAHLWRQRFAYLDFSTAPEITSKLLRKILACVMKIQAFQLISLHHERVFEQIWKHRLEWRNVSFNMRINEIYSVNIWSENRGLWILKSLNLAC